MSAYEVAVGAPSGDGPVTVVVRRESGVGPSPDRHRKAALPSHRAASICAVFNLALDAPAVGATRLRLSGHLDDEAARQVLHAAADAVRCGCSKLVIDLAELTSFDEKTSYAVKGCSQLGRFLPEGVTVVTRSQAGEALADTAGVAPHPADAHSPGTMVPCPAC